MDSFVKHYSYSFIANLKTINDDETYQCQDDDDDDDDTTHKTLEPTLGILHPILQ